MSFNDIKDGYSEIKIKGNLYKIAYDFEAIGRLEELNGSGFFNLPQVIDDLRVKRLADILAFCHVGFLRHHPDFDIKSLHDYGFFSELYIKCAAEFTRCAKLPDEYEKMVFEGREQEDKAVIKKKGVLSKLRSIFIKR